MQNVQLFDRETAFAAAPDVFPPDRFNAGVLVVAPSQELFDRLITQASVLKSYDGGGFPRQHTQQNTIIAYSSVLCG
jgi:hypothetical protein